MLIWIILGLVVIGLGLSACKLCWPTLLCKTPPSHCVDAPELVIPPQGGDATISAVTERHYGYSNTPGMPQESNEALPITAPAQSATSIVDASGHPLTASALEQPAPPTQQSTDMP
jgi:hypothetical protein